MDLQDCIPKNKHDIDAVERARTLGFPALEPILLKLLEWVQDANWPVATHVVHLLPEAGTAVVEPIRAILDSDDGVWKYWVVSVIIEHLSMDVRSQLHEDLLRLAQHPTSNDREEEVDLVAQEVLRDHFA